jgi:hypothetical protein
LVWYFRLRFLPHLLFHEVTEKRKSLHFEQCSPILLRAQSARSSASNAFRISTTNVPVHRGRKPDGPGSFPPRERTADVLRTKATRCVSFKGPQ